MEGLVAAAQDLLNDAAALEAARALDGERAEALPDLRDAFLGFRDADESFARLVQRIQPHLSRSFQPPAGGPPRNLWGFRTEEESRFAEHFVAASPRVPEVDLASLFRSYLTDPQSDEERIQVLLAFGEFVAGLDARGADGDPRLGIGPAAHFLTFAWHCASDGGEPLFTFAADRAIRAVARLGGLAGAAKLEGRDWEPRFQTFYEVARELERALPGRPTGMRQGWAVQHALVYALGRIERTGELAAAGDPGGSGAWRPKGADRGKPVIVGPGGRREAASPAPVTIEPPRGDAPTGPGSADSAPAGRGQSPGTDPHGTLRREETGRSGASRGGGEASAPGSDAMAPPDAVVSGGRPDGPAERPPDGERREGDRFRQIASSKQTRMERLEPEGWGSGASLDDVLPPDRTPPRAHPRPGEGSPDARPGRRQQQVRKVDPDRFERSGVPLEDVLPPDRSLSAPSRESGRRRPPSPAEAKSSRPSSRADEGERPKTAAQLQREAEERRAVELEKRMREISSEERRRLPGSPARSDASGPGAGADALAPDRAAAREEEPRAAAASGPARAATERGEARAVGRGDDEGSAAEVPMEDLLSEFRGEVVHTSRGEPEAGVHADRLARDLHLAAETCEELLAALAERGRLLLVGPPHVGKTHVARRLAIHVAGHTDRVLFLRLHPEMSYAALMGEPGGVVRTYCERAREDREQRYVLVLDELDRGDAARALGEVVGALAERGQEVSLASGQGFYVPRNLHVVATAREVPSDPALTGRFPTLPLPADPAVLRRFLAGYRPGLEWVADMLDALNRQLAEGRSHPAAVGHGLFMDVDLDVGRLRRIWEREVLPLLASYGVATVGLEYDALKPKV